MVRWKLLKVFGILLGIGAIALAVLVFTGSVGYYESFMQYGGDAYTGIQNAAAQTANNIMFLGETIRLGLASFLLIQGLVLLLGALCIRTKQKAPKEAPAAPVAPAAPAAPVAPVAPVQPVFAEPVRPPVQPQQPVPWTCPHCGTANEASYLFCQGCGKGK